MTASLVVAADHSPHPCVTIQALNAPSCRYVQISSGFKLVDCPTGNADTQEIGENPPASHRRRPAPLARFELARTGLYIAPRGTNHERERAAGDAGDRRVGKRRDAPRWLAAGHV
jgi:hypothetical protein